MFSQSQSQSAMDVVKQTKYEIYKNKRESVTPTVDDCDDLGHYQNTLSNLFLFKKKFKEKIDVDDISLELTDILKDLMETDNFLRLVIKFSNTDILLYKDDVKNDKSSHVLQMLSFLENNGENGENGENVKNLLDILDFDDSLNHPEDKNYTFDPDVTKIIKDYYNILDILKSPTSNKINIVSFNTQYVDPIALFKKVNGINNIKDNLITSARIEKVKEYIYIQILRYYISINLSPKMLPPEILEDNKKKIRKKNHSTSHHHMKPLGLYLKSYLPIKLKILTKNARVNGMNRKEMN